MTRWVCTDAELQDLVKKGRIKAVDVGLNAMSVDNVSKGNKYSAQKTTINGHRFDSKAEAAEYERLLLLQRIGEVKSIELQPKFLLQDGYVRGGKRIRAIYYIADFKIVTADDREVVIDVKSVATEKNAVYRLKRKMLLYKYPDIDFREV